MLAKKHRLAAERDFSRIFKRGRSMFVHGLGIRFVPNGLVQSRIAFTISTKVSKDAVVRNTLRRRLRETMRKILPVLAPGYDIVFTAKPDAARFLYGECEVRVIELLRRTRLITKI